MLFQEYTSHIQTFIPKAIYGVLRLDERLSLRLEERLDEKEKEKMSLYKGGSLFIFGLPIDSEALWFWNHLNGKRYLTANHILESIIVSLAEMFPASHIQSLDRISNHKIAQVVLAEMAGLGTRGWNNVLLHPEHGAYIQLTTIVTKDVFLDINYGRPMDKDVCIKCGRCVDACPVNALSPTDFFAFRCSSVVASPEKIKSKAVAVTSDSYVECRACIDSCPIGLNIEKLYEWKK
ncbi:MAG: 4Fe-4S ferredoxin, iron-sulfur binding [Bacteroidetes bacterium]|nr:4Fe-4S ferredoxin, iron-sulfur binding [Bacteroidota bacterium]